MQAPSTYQLLILLKSNGRKGKKVDQDRSFNLVIVKQTYNNLLIDWILG